MPGSHQRRLHLRRALPLGRRLRTALAPALAVAASACSVAVGAGGAARVEHLAPVAGPSQRALRVDARSTAELRGEVGRVAIALAPTAVLPLDSAPLRGVARAELQLTGAPRALWQPRLGVAAERGLTRSVDAAGDPLDPRRTLRTLETERVEVQAGLRYRLAPHRTLALRTDAAASGGRGSDAPELPTLSRVAATVEYRAEPDARRQLSLQLGTEAVVRASDAPWRTVGADLGWGRQRRLDRLSATLGVVQSLTDARRDARVTLAWQRSARVGRPGWALALEQAPALDRLDGRLRTRRRGRLTVEGRGVSGVSLRGSLQAIADAATEDARRGVGGEVTLRQPLGALAVLELELAHVLLWEGQTTKRAESRAGLGLRLPLR
jgi:hypothetical protein